MLAALGNHLWQSTVFAVAVGLLTLFFRNNSARVRHCLWLTASFKFLVPFSLLILLGSGFTPYTVPVGTHPTGTAPQWSILMERVAQPLSSSAQSAGAALSAPLPAKPFLDPTSVAIAVWVCGIAVVLCVLLLRWRRVNAALRTAQPFTGELQSGVPIAVKTSAALLEPGVIGIFRPVLLLPRGISERLRPEQLQAIVVHELCHVRRYDNLTGALHLVVQAVFWFHPLAWWIGARIVEERELACDEAVLESGSDPTVYAEGLLDVCAFYLASPLVCAAGVSGPSLKKRIRAIVHNQAVDKLHVAKKVLLAVVAALSTAFPIVTGVLHAPAARAQAPAALPVSPASASTSASIRLGAPDTLQRFLLIDRDGTFTLRNEALMNLISFAYDVQDAQIVGPAEELARLYSIDAKTATVPTPGNAEEDFHSMIRGVLADRFKLTSHWETRRVPTYALIGGAHSAIKQAAAGDPGPLLTGGANSITAQAVPFTLFDKFLAAQLERPILDQTGLAATYNFTLKWGPESGEPGAPAARVSPPDRPSKALLIDTLQKQLGLQVVPQEGDVRYLVIDHVIQPSDLVAAPKEVRVEPGVFDRYVGHYVFPDNRIITVSRDGERFLTQVTGQPQIQIFATSDQEFFAKAVDARLTFVTTGEGGATQLVLHQNGRDVTAPRISEAAAKAQEEALAQRVREQKAAPGSEALLRKYIEALEHNRPDYDDMEPATAAAIRPQWERVQQQFASAGQLQAITFKRVGLAGDDIYRARFEKLTYEMRIGLDAAGKITGLFFQRVPSGG